MTKFLNYFNYALALIVFGIVITFWTIGLLGIEPLVTKSFDGPGLFIAVRLVLVIPLLAGIVPFGLASLFSFDNLTANKKINFIFFSGWIAQLLFIPCHYIVAGLSSAAVFEKNLLISVLGPLAGLGLEVVVLVGVLKMSKYSSRLLDALWSLGKLYLRLICLISGIVLLRQFNNIYLAVTVLSVGLIYYGWVIFRLKKDNAPLLSFLFSGALLMSHLLISGVFVFLISKLEIS